MMNRPKWRDILASAVITGLVGLAALVMVIPIYISIINAFKMSRLIQRSPLALPLPPTLDNITRAIGNENIHVGTMYFNTITLMVFAVLICIFVSSMAAYYLARRKSRLAKWLRIYFLIGIMVPYVIVYLPLCVILRIVHIPFGLPTLIIIFVSGNISFSTFIYTNYIRTLPFELEEVSMIDGAGRWTIFWRILFPLLKPCTATVMIFVGIGVWNDFMTPLLLGQVKTITVGIYTAIGPHSADWGLSFAFVLFATVPVIIAFLFLQKQFIAGLTAGAVKG
ncbi:MAG: carbohydrate ABC transporter permease [Spirochaetaceae bacterium]|jgi:raffinose/stachyose/melibiose transport system permease protein|nr:carbohydrate ABC transporter permease [Spirochaetaceae bacterium]